MLRKVVTEPGVHQQHLGYGVQHRRMPHSVLDQLQVFAGGVVAGEQHGHFHLAEQGYDKVESSKSRVMPTMRTAPSGPASTST